MVSGPLERFEWAVAKDGELRAVRKEVLEPGFGDGRRGVRVMGLVGNWDPVVDEGERSWDVDGEVGVGIRGELRVLVIERRAGTGARTH